MMRILRDVRLIPIVLVATISLFALKVSGLVFDGGYTLAERIDRNLKDRQAAPLPMALRISPGLRPPTASPGKQRFDFAAAGDDITGSVEKKEEKERRKEREVGKARRTDADNQRQAARAAEGRGRQCLGADRAGHIASAGERAVLERLRDRNQELDARRRELDMRENLIKAAEKRLEAKVGELKDTEVRVNTAIGTRDKAEAARFNSIVAMYENMKPKDAARIFDRLDLNILVDVTTKINPRKMSDILAQMKPDAAERLTVELANRAGTAPKSAGADQLPKIEGKPVAQ